jgi:hypothetical protein
MKTQLVFSASAAAMLVVSMAAFAQTPPSSPPSTQASTQQETPVTLVGCVMRETDYRKANDSGRGGPLGTGLGRGDEFVLVNATKTATGSDAAAAAGECSSAATRGQAYELSGSREKDLAQYVGRAVEINGMLKPAKTETGPQEEPRPTGGFDPLKQDLKLFEVDVVSVREVPAAQSAAAAPPAAAPAAEPPAATAQPPAPAPAPPSQQVASAAPREDLPRTASPLPLTGLLGLLSLGTGLVLRRRA